jgi:cytochrome d ubiquinol oxidase subunit II
MTDLQLTWYVILAVLACGYAVLDGFDLGAGLLTLFAWRDRRRAAVVHAILPVWDGNEVWLLAAAGASFAAFPPVYASVFSGLYPAMMVFLFALIFRAVALGFSAHENVGVFRLGWHLVLSASSAVALVLVGMVVGNLLNGLPLDEHGNYAGSHWGMFNALSITIGLLSLTMMAMHGALYLGLRLQGDMIDWARRWANAAWGVSMALLLLAAWAAIAARTNLTANYEANPALWAVPMVTVVAFVLTGFLNTLRQSRAAFAASVLSIVGLLVTAFAAMFPRIVPAAVPEHSLTIGANSSSETALKAMLIIALIGMPLVLGYTAWVYWLFRAPVSHEEHATEYPG